MSDSTAAPSYRKKLIEVALPLEAINAAAAKEKSIRHGHPSTLHLWWARRPLAACRAVLFGQFVDDPSSVPGEFPTEEAQEAERQRLFRIIEEMVPWANSNDEAIFHRARVEVARSIWRDLDDKTRASIDPAFTKAFGGETTRSAEQLTRDQVIQFLQTHAPPVLDPFAGGGSIPLEAQRLGLRVLASDLNPVAVLINKALIDIPSRFEGRSAVHASNRQQERFQGSLRGAHELARDVRAYGVWIQNEARRRLTDVYPKVTLPVEYGGKEADVVAWLWARTVTCPNPACGAQMPLVRTFQLSGRKGGEVWATPEISGKTVRFKVTKSPPELKATKDRNSAVCIFCRGANVTDVELRKLARQHLGVQLLAVVADGPKGRVYLDSDSVEVPNISPPHTPWLETPLPDNARWFSPPGYGLTRYRDIFTERQLLALSTFSDLIKQAAREAEKDAISAGWPVDETPLAAGGSGARAYGEAVATYLAFALSKVADRGSSICTWFLERDSTRNTFARQAIPMTYDFAELNTLLEGTGSFAGAVEWTAESLEGVPAGVPSGNAEQADALTMEYSAGCVLNTDPPYYDNIGYADLSDFFYVWLRHILASQLPASFGTLLVPKETELVASPQRFGGSKQKAAEFFENGFRRVFSRLHASVDDRRPIVVYYAFKQSEKKAGDEGIASTGWETMLSGLVSSGYAVTGTWPLRTELANKMIGHKSNILASSIAISCRKRVSRRVLSRADFIRALRETIPAAMHRMQQGSVAPVDFAQAAIGPGMEIFSACEKVVEADGTAMTVRSALQIINQELDTFLASDDGSLDADTRFAVAWYEQHRGDCGLYGDAETLARAKNTAVQGVIEAGILRSAAGKAQLIPTNDLPVDWDPTTDTRPTVWEATHHLIRRLESAGEQGAAQLLSKLGPAADAARSLAYRLYSVCERKGWAEDARAYNALILSWPDIARLARGEARRGGIETWAENEGENDEESPE